VVTILGLEFMMQIYGVSQTDIANLCGIQKQNIQIWITGKQDVSHKHIGKIASYFDQPENLIVTHVDLVQQLEILDRYEVYLIKQEPVELWDKYKENFVIRKC